MSREKLLVSSDDLDRLLGHRVEHIERVPSPSGGPGAYHWVLSVRPLPADAGVNPLVRHLGADVPCTCPERPCPRASVALGGQRPLEGWASELEEPRCVTIDKMA